MNNTTERMINRTTLFTIAANLGIVLSKWNYGITVNHYLLLGTIFILFGDLLMIGIQVYLDNDKTNRWVSKTEGLK